MNWNTVFLLCRHELRMLLRARRTVAMSIVVPAMVMPLTIVATRCSLETSERITEETTYRYAVAGTWDERARSLIRSGLKKEEFKDLKAEEVRVEDPEAKLRNGDIHFYVRTLGGEEADADEGAKTSKKATPASGDARSGNRRLKGVPLLQVVFRGNDVASSAGSGRMSSLLESARRSETQTLLAVKGFPAAVFKIEERNLATDDQVSGSTLGRFFTVLLVMLIFTGGGVAAMDIVAGEKERGTIETLLTTAADRGAIIAAKQVAISAVALAITAIQALNFLIYIRFELIRLPANVNLAIPGTSALLLLVLFVPVAATIAAALLAVSARARTYKEAQLHFLPLYLLSLVPALAATIPGLRLRSAIALVPIANVSIAAREILMGRPDMPMLLVTFLAMTATAVLLMRYSARLLVREDIIVPSQADTAALAGGDVLFRARIVRWFGIMWVMTLMASLTVTHVPTLLLVNELVVFAGASLVMLVKYRLRPTDALSLRSVPWPVWLAIPIAIPAGQIVSVGLSRIAEIFVPAPREELEQFGNAILGSDIPLWQLYVLAAILPAICEEIAFRGMLLHGLRKRFTPLARALVVGAVFGVFHYALFRIVPTAFLGVVLTAIAIWSGSIFPGIVFHAGNNALALWLGTNDFPLDMLGPADYALATAVFALAMWVIYRTTRRTTCRTTRIRGR